MTKLFGFLLSLGNVIYDWYELVRCIATYVDSHEYLPLDLVVELLMI